MCVKAEYESAPVSQGLRETKHVTALTEEPKEEQRGREAGSRGEKNPEGEEEWRRGTGNSSDNSALKSECECDNM